MDKESGDPKELEARIEALEARAQRCQVAFDNISQGVCFYDREQRVVLCNRRFAEIYRLTPDQVPPGATLRQVVERRFAAGTCPMAVDDYLAYSESINAKREVRVWSVTLDDGRTIRVRHQPTPDGGWVSTHEDVTESQEKRVLIEERVSMQTLIDLVPDNLWVKDAESRFLIANVATATRMGLATPKDLIGKSDLALCPWETAQKYLADEHRVLTTGQPMIDSEEYVLSPDGGKLWIATTKVPLRNEADEIIGVIGVSRDVTRRRLGDALREGQAEILEMIARGASADSVLDELTHLVESQSPEIVGSIMLFDDDRRPLRHGEASNLGEAFRTVIEGHRIDLLVGPCGEAIRRGDIVVAADIASDPLWTRQRDFAAAHGLRACWSTPILSRGGEPLGVVAIFARSARQPSEAEAKLAHVVAQLAGIAVERDSASVGGTRIEPAPRTQSSE